MIRIIKENEDIIKILFPYVPDFVAKIKTISGRQWHPEGKYWTIPYDDDALTMILKLFEGSDIYVDPELKRKEQYCDFDDVRKELIARKYSNKTVKTYVYYNRDLLSFSGKIPSEITNTDIVDYLVYLAENKNVATATMNQAINAFKFYYGSMLKKEVCL